MDQKPEVSFQDELKYTNSPAISVNFISNSNAIALTYICVLLCCRCQFVPCCCS